MSTAPCPNCGRKYQSTTGVFYCAICQWQFDDDPDEGGSDNDDPVKAAIANEQSEAFKKAMRRGRGRRW